MRSTIARFASIAVLAVLASTSACAVRVKGVDGNGDWVSETRSVRGFSKVVLRGPFEAKVREGGEPSLVVWIDSNLKQFVTTTVSGDTLVIDTNQVIYSKGRATIDLRVPRLDAFSHEGSGKVTIVGAEQHEEVDLALRGSGVLLYQGSAEKLDVESSGSGDVKLSGTAGHLEADIKGSGDIDARSLPSNGGRFQIDGSGDILASLRGGEIACTITGSGDIRWLGKARIISMDTRGSGTAGQL